MAGNFVSALSAGQPVAVNGKGHTEKKFRKARYFMPVVAVDCYSQPACEGGSRFGLREGKIPRKDPVRGQAAETFVGYSLLTVVFLSFL